jgi:MFS family permease
MARIITKEERERSLKYSTLDGAAYSAMVGVGESYFTPFALALGAGNFTIGVLSAVPNLLGALAQPFGAWLAVRLRSRKTLVVAGALAQAFVWIGLIALALAALPRELALAALVGLVALYWVLGSVLHPAWTSLMGDLVPAKGRGRYFGTRNEVTGFASLVAVGTGGWLLGLFSGQVLAGFSLLFVLALLARMASAYYLTLHSEPAWMPAHRPALNAVAFLRKTWNTDFGRLTVYGTVMLFAVNIAAPFFAVYMLRDLRFDYFTFGLIGAISIVTRMLSMPYWGRLGDRYGNRAVIGVAGTLIPLIPLLWLLNTSVAWILLVEAFAGFVWGAFDLAIFDYLMDTSNRQNRAEYFAHFSVFNGFARFAGAGVGGVLAGATNGSVFLGLAGLQIIILSSGVLRVLTSGALLPIVREVKPREELPRHFLWEAAAIYPAEGVIGRILHAPRALLDVEHAVVERARRAVGR